MSINVDVHKVAHGSKVAPDDDLRRSATILAKATGTNFGTDAIGAIMERECGEAAGGGGLRDALQGFKRLSVDVASGAAELARGVAGGVAAHPAVGRVVDTTRVVVDTTKSVAGGVVDRVGRRPVTCRTIPRTSARR